jgi:putative PIN family toxin of toxin-antitoxin system
MASGDSTGAIIIVVRLPTIVVDTNVLVGAMTGRAGHNRQVLRACFEDRVKPIVGEALFLEYEEVLERKAIFRKSPLSAAERRQLYEAFLSVCEWVHVYYSWRPNLRDEGDNHLVELAVAGGASAIVTNNVGDFRSADLRFPEIRVLAPGDFLKELS